MSVFPAVCLLPASIKSLAKARFLSLRPAGYEGCLICCIVRIRKTTLFTIQRFLFGLSRFLFTNSIYLFFYYIFYYTLGSFWMAPAKVTGDKWAYISVVFMELCPKSLLTVYRSTPFCTKWLANVCRNL